tara:strand:+ start:76 stop:258 length:183 start_codon:yes stop_codon:yes gene_type:complete
MKTKTTKKTSKKVASEAGRVLPELEIVAQALKAAQCDISRAIVLLKKVKPIVASALSQKE